MLVVMARIMEWGKDIGQPRRLYVEKGCERESLVREVLNASSKMAVHEFTPGTRDRVPAGVWVLRRQKGRFLKRCPGTRNYICCGYHVLNLVLGCPFQCRYCILQDYLGDNGITIFVNLDDAFDEVRCLVENRNGIVRIGTGELADSLALEGKVLLSKRLIPFFRTLPGAVLEFKTKSANVDVLLELPHGGHTVLSWSLNPPSIIQRAEQGTPSLEMRLQAARRCQEKGYPIGIHFDPIVWSENWQDEYHGLVRTVLSDLDPGRIIWISLGALRYPPSLKERFLISGLGLGELVPGLDGKFRYLRPLRAKMFRSMVKWIREFGGDIFVYLCMESPEIWMASVGWSPQDMADLDRCFQRRVIAFWQDPW